MRLDVAKSLRRSFLMFDVIAAVALTMALLLLFALSTSQYAAAQRESGTRRMLRLAAEAELARWRVGLVTGAESGSTATTQAADGIALETTWRPGTDRWRGLVLVRVVDSKLVAGHPLHVEMSGYVAPRGTGP